MAEKVGHRAYNDDFETFGVSRCKNDALKTVEEWDFL